MQVDMDIDESRDAEMEPLSPDVALAHRLTNRLRKERDDALRHYDFLKMEMKFKVESLEKELRDTEAYAKSLENRTPIPSNEYSSTSLYPFRQAALVSSLVLHHIQGEMQWQQDELMSTGESLLTTEWKLRQAEGRLQSKDGALETLQKDNASLQEQLDATEEELSASRNQVRDLTSRIASLEQMTEREKRSHEDIGSSLATVEAELEDVSRNLANAESSRDSLALQVTHLEQDLEKTQAELHHAEARYSELQAQQLSTMSSSGVTRSLRDQILELEQRILRRTEQIGLHQHDIKRLEANLRLQEDRVTEMTAELEVADREREAMIEDCESTREQRNETLKKCEELEESLEAMEGRVGELEGQRDLEVQSLVEVIMKGASMRRTASKAMLTSLSRHAQAESRVQSHLHAVDSSSSETHSEIKRLREIVEEKNCALQALESERDKAVANARTASESLQTAQVNSRATTTRFDDIRDENSSLQKEIAHLRTDLQSKENELFSLQQEYESWKLRDAERKADDRSRFEARIEKLEEECKTLHETYGDLERRHAETSEDLRRANEQVDEYVLSTAKRDTLERELRNDSETLRQRYEQESKQLQAELAIARADLEDAKQQHVDLEHSHQETLEEISRAKEAIETQLKSATSRLNATLQAEGELGTIRAQYEEQVKDLEERLNMASNDVDSISQDRDQLQEKYEQSSQKLRDVEFQLTELRNRYDSEVKDLRERLAKASADLELALQGQSERDATLRSTIQRLEEEATVSSQKQVSLDAEVVTLREQAAHLDTKLAALSGERETLSKEYDELKTQHEHILQELSNSKANGDDHLVHLTQEVEQLRADLKTQTETCQRLEEERSQAIERSEQAHQAQHELGEQLEGLSSQLQETSALLQKSKVFEQQLQESMTELEAQVQKSLSMQRYQESQIQERDGEVAALQEKLHLFQTTLQQTEQATKAAEVKFTFQISQDEQTIAGLRREIVSLRGNSALQQTVTELREKNEEMEQLLRAKCLEIEDNDDRFIELIKEKKKLNSKVESLTRKVTNLQAKLAAVPAPAPPSTSVPTPVPVPTSSHAAPALALSSSLHASSSKAPPPTFTRTPSTPSSSRSRTTSGPSVFSRSKTPEPKIPPPPVFRPRTPESKRLPAIPAQPNSPPPTTMYTSSSSSTSSGKKRRAPDDFDECEGLPPQVFTSDSMPSHDNEAFTPRVRRALNSVRTGFTPVRGSGLGSRPTPNQLSPRRATTGSPMIADVTNSPRGRKHSENPADKASKRSGWLGKMRGGQGTRSTNALSRPVFERPQNQGAGPAR